MTKSRILLCALLMATVPATAIAQGRGQKIQFSDEAVETAITKACKHLWSLHNNTPGQAPWPDKRTVVDHTGKTIMYPNYGGYSALVMYSLLASGERWDEPRMKQAISWLAKLKSEGTYCIGTRMQVWTYLPRKYHLKLLQRDASILLRSVARPVRGKSHTPLRYGLYSYTSSGKPTDRGDHSNTHFGVLGVWAAERAGIGEIPKGYWKLIFKHYLMTQHASGTWQYGQMDPRKPAWKPGSQYAPAGMTAAGLANTLVAWEMLHSADFAQCGKNPNIPAVDRAVGWLGKNFGKYASGYHYYAYALERVGLATGYKFIGDHDWYKTIATRLINTQRPNGSWAKAGFGDNNDLASTTFALLFLVRGRNPILCNRLRYNGDWNNRPNALSFLCRWMSHTIERQINWQIVGLDAPVEQWHDSQILLISGSKKPNFTDADLDKLRKFVHQGGTILSIAECRGRGFKTAVRETYAKLFPKYELEPIDAEHTLYSLNRKIRRKPKLEIISNGARPLVIHTDEDWTLAWQLQKRATARSSFSIAVNLVMYLTGNGKDLRRRGATPWPDATAAPPTTRKVTVARIKHDGNWDPEPLALERLKLLLARHAATELTIAPSVDAAALDAVFCPSAVLTGTGKLTLSDKQQAGLKAYVEAGGTVVVDAAGGDEAFADSARAILEKTFGPDSLNRLASTAAVYSIPGMKITRIGCTPATRKRPGQNVPRIEAVEINNQPRVFFSTLDLTCGLVGYPSLTIKGYSPGPANKPGSAYRLMRNMLIYPTTKPAG